MITRLKHHDRCEVYVQLEYYRKIGHYASLHCKHHNKWIQWLHKWDVDSLRELGVEVKPRKLLSLKDVGL